jgi:hypothetical protein
VTAVAPLARSSAGSGTRTPSPTSTSSPARLPGRKFIAGEPMKPATKSERVVVDVDRAADLLDHAEVHHDHAVGERHRLDLVVGDEDAGGLQLPVQLLDLEAHLHAQLGVEVGERLVEQERGGLAHDRAPHGHALALPAGERARLPVEEAAQLEDLRRALHALVDLRGGMRRMRSPYDMFSYTVMCG